MCGTLAGYKKHKYYKTQPCVECLQAAAKYNRERYQKNLEKNRERNRLRNTKPERRKYRSEWKKANKEHLDQYAKDYRKNNREKVAEQKRNWKRNNIDKVRDSLRKAQNKRRVRILNNITIPYTESQIIEAYGTNCYICGLEVDFSAPRQTGKPGWQKGLHIDHVIPIAKNGPDILENVRPSHALCNLQKGANVV